ncbi:MAG: class I SAM-dependent methyltransferase [Candidatus Limnocylindrales bacterium]|jgi:predicted O-methyltransferase YrrM
MNLIPETIRTVMAELKARDAEDRSDGTPHEARLRAISPEVGQFLLTLAISIGATTIVEVGTSGGYSTLWLAIAASKTGGRVITFENDAAKAVLARDTFERAGVGRVVELREGDGGADLLALGGPADLVFIDSEKRDYIRLLDLAVGVLGPGGLFVADNLISHESELVEFRARALADPRLTGLVVPIGAGELVAVRL